jgi:predicted nucleic acid-binding protein
VSRDYNDDMALACAVKAAVDYIVTRDDLLILESHKKVKIITPEQFMQSSQRGTSEF